MHEENPTTMEMIQRILFFNKINKNKRIYSEDSFVTITGDCSVMSGSLSFYLALLTQEIIEEISDYKRYSKIYLFLYKKLQTKISV